MPNPDRFLRRDQSMYWTKWRFHLQITEAESKPTRRLKDEMHMNMLDRTAFGFPDFSERSWVIRPW